MLLLTCRLPRRSAPSSAGRPVRKVLEEAGEIKGGTGGVQQQEGEGALALGLNETRDRGSPPRFRHDHCSSNMLSRV